MTHYNIDFYQHLSFIVLDDNDIIIKEDIKLQVGDIVEVEGQDGDDDVNIDNEKWFARIQAILVHQSNDDNYHVFLLFE